MMPRTLIAIPLVIAVLMFSQTFGQSEMKNIEYAKIGSHPLLLDLYMPVKKNPVLLVWIHGGAWQSGSKESPPTILVRGGYALASVDYRLSGEAPFPAMVHDIKASIRFLRANASRYGYNATRVIVCGSSAGGHLAALVGTTNNDSFLEGSVGGYTSTSSAVQGIIDFYGPTNLTTILSQSTPHGLSVRIPALEKLLGKPVEEVPDLARKASPVLQVDPGDPPLFIAHGDQDNQVPVNQSLELWSAYKENNLNVKLEIVPGAGHGSDDYYQETFMEKVFSFLNELAR